MNTNAAEAARAWETYRAVTCRDESGHPLTTIQIAPPGRIKSKNGEFTIDRAAFERMQAEFTSHGNDLPVDVEHESTDRGILPKDLRGAVGWIKSLSFDESRGVEATVQWTDEGRDLIRSGKFIYLSPTFYMDKKEKTMVIGLHSAGLVMHPAIPHMKQLAAGQRKPLTEENPMNELTLIGKPLGLAEADCTVEKITNAIDEFKKKATTPDGASSVVANAARTALGLKTDAGESEVILAVNSLKQSKDSASTMQAELTTLKNKIADREVDDLIAAHGKGKINPNDALDVKVCRDVARQNPEEFKKWMAARPVILEGGRTNPPEGGAKKAGAGKEEEMIANSLKAHGGDYAKGVAALQKELMQPFRDAGLGALGRTHGAHL